MCLSTVYKNEKQDDNILCKFVANIDVDGDKLTFEIGRASCRERVSA